MSIEQGKVNPAKMPPRKEGPSAYPSSNAASAYAAYSPTQYAQTQMTAQSLFTGDQYYHWQQANAANQASSSWLSNPIFSWLQQYFPFLQYLLPYLSGGSNATGGDHANPTRHYLEPSQGEINIVGTSQDDKIVVKKAADKSGDLEVTVNNQVIGYIRAADAASATIRIHGLEGNDSINVKQGRGNFVVFGGKGNDQIQGSNGNDVLYGEDGEDTIYGNKGKDQLYGGAGKDDLDGGAGDDTIRGEDDEDILRGGRGNDDLDGGNYRDQIDAGDGDDQITDRYNQDIVEDGPGLDQINGQSAEDKNADRTEYSPFSSSFFSRYR